MPHVIVEYSANLAELVDISELLQALHEAALKTGIFPIGGLRTRAAPRDHYVIADGHEDNAFIYVVLRIGHGRDLDTRRRASDTMFSTLCAFLEKTFADNPLSIGLELQEIDPELSFKHNNLHEIVKKRVN